MGDFINPLASLQQQGFAPPEEPQPAAAPPPQVPPIAATSSGQPIPPQSGRPGTLKSMLFNFMQGAGESMIHESGGKTPWEKQQEQIQVQQRQQQIAQAGQQIQSMEKYRQIQELIQRQKAEEQPITEAMAANSPALAPFKGQFVSKQGIQDIIKQSLANQGKENVAGINADSREAVAQAKALQAGVAITPELAKQYGFPADFVGKTMKVSDVSARENAATRKAQMGIAAGNLSLRQKAFERDTFGTIFGKDVPSSLVNESNETIGWKSPSAPGANLKMQAQQSQDLVKIFDNVSTKIDELDKKGKLGPLSGRLNDIMTGKIGMEDPEFADLRMIGSLAASGVLKAHFGSRGGTQVYKEFEDRFNVGKMTANNLKGAMSGMKTFLNQYATRARTAGDVKGAPAPAKPANTNDPLGIR